jgi:hypothetical protein
MRQPLAISAWQRPADAKTIGYRDDLAAVCRFTAAQATHAGLDPGQVADLVIAFSGEPGMVSGRICACGFPDRTWLVVLGPLALDGYQNG